MLMMQLLYCAIAGASLANGGCDGGVLWAREVANWPLLSKGQGHTMNLALTQAGLLILAILLMLDPPTPTMNTQRTAHLVLTYLGLMSLRVTYH